MKLSSFFFSSSNCSAASSSAEVSADTEDTSGSETETSADVSSTSDPREGSALPHPEKIKTNNADNIMKLSLNPDLMIKSFLTL